MCLPWGVIYARPGGFSSGFEDVTHSAEGTAGATTSVSKAGFLYGVLPLIGGFGVFTGQHPRAGMDGRKSPFPHLTAVGRGSPLSLPHLRSCWSLRGNRLGVREIKPHQEHRTRCPFARSIASPCGSAACRGIIPGYSRLFPGKGAPQSAARGRPSAGGARTPLSGPAPPRPAASQWESAGVPAPSGNQ